MAKNSVNLSLAVDPKTWEEIEALKHLVDSIDTKKLSLLIEAMDCLTRLQLVGLLK